MIRSDIKIIQQSKTIIIQSDKHFFSFSRHKMPTIEAFCTADLTPEMIADIILSGIVSIMSYNEGSLILSPKFGYDMMKMQDVIVAIFEKFDL